MHSSALSLISETLSLHITAKYNDVSYFRITFTTITFQTGYLYVRNYLLYSSTYCEDPVMQSERGTPLLLRQVLNSSSGSSDINN